MSSELHATPSGDPCSCSGISWNGEIVCVHDAPACEGCGGHDETMELYGMSALGGGVDVWLCAKCAAEAKHGA